MAAQKKSTDINTQHRTRGAVLTIWLILLVFQSILAVILVLDLTKQPEDPSRPYIVGALFVISAVKLVGVLGIWLWKKWGLFCYASALVGISIIGLILTGNMGILFFELLPIAITGWLIREKLAHFN